MNRRFVKARQRAWVLFWTAAFVLLPWAAMAQNSPAAGLSRADRADVAATALLVTGVLLLLLEIKIVSFGLLGVLGTACLVVATGVMWEHGRDFWGVSVYYLIPVLLLILILTVWMSVLAARAYRERVVSGKEGFVGEIAEASEALSPNGRVFFQGSYWQAESCGPVAAGQKVRVVGVENLTLFVEPIPVTQMAAAAVCAPAEVNPVD